MLALSSYTTVGSRGVQPAGQPKRKHRKTSSRQRSTTHIGARIAARITLIRVTRALDVLPTLAFRGGGIPVHLRRLRDCLELQETAQDILLQYPTAERRGTREFAAAWLLEAPSLPRRVHWDVAAPSVDEVCATRDLRQQHGTCT